MQIQIPKGLFDILPYGTDKKWMLSAYWQYVESIIRKLCQDYGYQELRTPIFERTELFQKSVGETSDIVTKEMYTFFDRAKRSMSLRPEGTAALMRAFIENNIQASGEKHKFYYLGPMFRYERPQSGKYRQIRSLHYCQVTDKLENRPGIRRLPGIGQSVQSGIPNG